MAPKSGGGGKRRRERDLGGSLASKSTPVEMVLQLDDDDDPDASEEVSIDVLGRVSGVSDCGLDFAFRAFPRAVPARLHASLVKDCESAFVGESFWLGASSEPRCALESLARLVFEAHAGSVTADFDPERSGAEWWVQLRHADDGQAEAVSFHWDKDEDLVDEFGVNVHPAISTVTYLADAGAPTLVLDKTPPTMYEDVDGFRGACGAARLSYPEAGKHVVFDGRLLHGAPRELARAVPSGYLRVSFLVNVWLGYKPRGIEPFPDSELAPLGLRSPLSTADSRDVRAGLARPDANAFEVMDVSNREDDDGIVVFEYPFGETGTEHTLRVPAPTKRLEAATRGNVELRFGGMEGRRWWRRRGGRREYEGDERSRGEREDESGSSSEVTRDDRVCISR